MDVLSIAAKVAFGVCCLLLLDMVRRGIAEPRKFREGFGYIAAVSLGTLIVAYPAFLMS